MEDKGIYNFNKGCTCLKNVAVTIDTVARPQIIEERINKMIKFTSTNKMINKKTNYKTSLNTFLTNNIGKERTTEVSDSKRDGSLSPTMTNKIATMNVSEGNEDHGETTVWTKKRGLNGILKEAMRYKVYIKNINKPRKWCNPVKLNKDIKSLFPKMTQTKMLGSAAIRVEFASLKEAEEALKVNIGKFGDMAIIEEDRGEIFEIIIKGVYTDFEPNELTNLLRERIQGFIKYQWCYKDANKRVRANLRITLQNKEAYTKLINKKELDLGFSKHLIHIIPNNSKNKLFCYNCHMLGHNEKVCWHEDRVCHKCGVKGHTESSCGKKYIKCGNCRGRHSWREAACRRKFLIEDSNVVGGSMESLQALIREAEKEFKHELVDFLWSKYNKSTKK